MSNTLWALTLHFIVCTQSVVILSAIHSLKLCRPKQHHNQPPPPLLSLPVPWPVRTSLMSSACNTTSVRPLSWSEDSRDGSWNTYTVTTSVAGMDNTGSATHTQDQLYTCSSKKVPNYTDCMWDPSWPYNTPQQGGFPWTMYETPIPRHSQTLSERVHTSHPIRHMLVHIQSSLYPTQTGTLSYRPTPNWLQQGDWISGCLFEVWVVIDYRFSRNLTKTTEKNGTCRQLLRYMYISLQILYSTMSCLTSIIR